MKAAMFWKIFFFLLFGFLHSTFLHDFGILSTQLAVGFCVVLLTMKKMLNFENLRWSLAMTTTFTFVLLMRFPSFEKTITFHISSGRDEVFPQKIQERHEKRRKRIFYSVWFHVILLFFLQSFPPVYFLEMKRYRARRDGSRGMETRRSGEKWRI